MVKSLFNELELLDLLIAGLFTLFAFSESWTSATVLISALALKGFKTFYFRPDKKDDITKLEEQIKKIQGEVRGLNLKLFGSRNA